MPIDLKLFGELYNIFYLYYKIFVLPSREIVHFSIIQQMRSWHIWLWATQLQEVLSAILVRGRYPE